MWERVSNLASFVTGEEGDEGTAPRESDQRAAVGGDPTEAQLQQMEQERLIVHLKEMIRQSEKTSTEREAELKKMQAEYSKFRLQSKSKIASLTAQAEQVQKSMSESMERASVGSDESSNTMASEASTSSVSDQKSRARNLVLKKRIADKDRKIAEKDRMLEARARELEAKTRIISERDAVVESFRAQLESQGGVIERLQGQLTTAGGVDESGANEITRRQLETRMTEMLAQMTQKDNQIIDLANEITERDKKVMDLQECVSEKDEVIRGRNQAIALLQAASKQAAEGSGLQQGRDQEAFAEVLQAMEQRLMESKELVSSKEKVIEQLRAEAKDMYSKLQTYADEHVRMERLISEQAETIRASLLESKISIEGGDQDSRLCTADARLTEQAEEIRQLKARLDDATAASSDNKLSKFKSLAGSKIKALEKEVEELKQVGDLRGEVAELKNHVAELEEEKGTMQLLLLDLEDKQGAVSSSSSISPDLQQQLGSLQRELSTLSHDKVTLEAEVERLNRSLEQANQQEMELNANMNSTINQLQTCRNDLEEKTNMVTFYEEQIRQVNSQQEMCNKELEEKTRTNSVLEDQLKHISRQMEESHKEIEERTRTIAALEDNVRLVNIQLDESNKEAVERARIVTALEDQIRQIVDFHRRNLDELDAEKSTTVKRLEVELSRVNDVYEELQKENVRLQSAIADQSEKKSIRDSLHEDKCIQLERELELLRLEGKKRDEIGAEENGELTELRNEASLLRNDAKQQFERLQETELQLWKKDVQIQNLSAVQAEREEMIVRLGLELKQKEELIERCTSNLKEKDDDTVSRLLVAESTVAERDAMLEAAATSVKERNSKIAELEAQIEEKDALINVQVSDISSLSEQLQDAIAEGEKVKNRLQELSEYKESTRMLLEEKEMRLKEFLSTVDRSSEQSQSLKAGLDIAAGQNRFLQESLEKLEKQISERDQSVCALQDEVRRKTEESARLSATLEKLQASSEEESRAEDSRRNEEYASANTRVEELRSSLIEKEKEMNSLKSDLFNVQQNLEIAEKKIADRDKKIVSLSENYQEEEAQLVALTEELDNIRVELASEKSSAQNLQGVLASKAAAFAELNDLMEKKDAKEKKYVALVKKLKQQIDDTKHEHQQQIEQADQLREEQDAEQRQLADDKLSQQLLSDQQLAQQQIAELKLVEQQTVEQQQSQQRLAEREVFELRSSVDRLTIELTAALADVEKLQNESQSKSVEMELLVASLNEAHHQVDAKSSSYSFLEVEHETERREYESRMRVLETENTEMHNAIAKKKKVPTATLR